MSRTITPAQHAELKRRVAHAQQLRDEREGRDLAHEADMEALRREQLRGDVGEDEPLGDPDEHDYDYDYDYE